MVLEIGSVISLSTFATSVDSSSLVGSSFTFCGLDSMQFGPIPVLPLPLPAPLLPLPLPLLPLHILTLFVAKSFLAPVVSFSSTNMSCDLLPVSCDPLSMVGRANFSLTAFLVVFSTSHDWALYSDPTAVSGVTLGGECGSNVVVTTASAS